MEGPEGLRSARHPRVRALHRWSRRSRARIADDRFVIDGPVLVREALAAGVEIEAAFIAPEELDGRDPTLADELRGRGIRCDELRAATLAAATDTVTSQGVAAVAVRSSLPALEAGPPADGGLLVALDRVADPGNLGTVLRSVEAAGATGVIVGADSCEVTSPKVVRAAAGALFRVPVQADRPLGALIDALAGEGWVVVGCAADGEWSLDDVDLRPATVVVVGNEAHGLSPEVLERLDATLRIPMVAGESLNVAMAATVVVFEAARRRRAAGAASTGPAGNRFAASPHRRQGERP